MSSDQPIATVDRDGKPAALKSLVLVLFFGPLGAFFGGEPVASALGTGVMVGRVVAGVVPTVLVALLAYFFGGRGTVSFHEDFVRLRHQTVPYEDVTVAVREDSFADRLFGTSTFRLVVLDGTNMTLRYAKEPDEVSRLLAEKLTVPAEQFAEAPAERGEDSRADGPDFMEERWQFWEYWRGDEQLPETALVGLEDLERVMDVGAVSVRYLDSVDMRDADGLSDIDKDDVTSSSSPTNP